MTNPPKNLPYLTTVTELSKMTQLKGIQIKIYIQENNDTAPVVGKDIFVFNTCLKFM